MLSVESDVQLQAACEKIQAIAKGMRLDEKMRFGGMAFSPNGNTCFGVDNNNLMVCRRSYG